MICASSPICCQRGVGTPRPGRAARFTAAVVVSFLLFGPYLANLSRDYTRYCYFWNRQNTLVLIVLVLGLGIMLGLAGEVARYTRRGWLIALSNHAFVLLLGTGLLFNLAFVVRKLEPLAWAPSRWQMGLLWLAASSVGIWAVSRPGSKCVTRCRQLCQIIGPAVPVTFMGLLFVPGYPERMEPLPGHVPAQMLQPVSDATRSGGVYVFIFDEWSYERTFAHGQVLNRFPHLAAFARTATMYIDAHSPAGDTERSLPGILFQTNDVAAVDHGRLGFMRGGKFVPTHDYQSIFARLEPLGYRGVMLGAGLPYRLWLGAQVDVCRSYSNYPCPSGVLGQMGVHLLRGFHYAPDPWTHRWYKTWERAYLHKATCDTLANVRADVHRIISEGPPQTFLVAHLFLPHMPAVLEPDLTFRPVERTVWHDGSLIGYEANLQAMDRLAGEFMEALRLTDKFTDSLVVFTSDHSWRHDPERTSGHSAVPITHVPLLVKVPGQIESRVVESRFETRDLGVLIEQSLRPGSRPEFACSQRSHP